jgi:AmmeMemoRadiSam system protein B
MKTSNDYPRVRFVDAFPVPSEEGQMIALRDPAGIAEEILVVSPDVFCAIQFFDGKHSFQDIRGQYLQTVGKILANEDLSEIIESLDEHFFLESDRFMVRRRGLEANILKSKIRPAAHAGLSYEADPRKLKAQLSSYYSEPKGAGKPNGYTNGPIRGLIAPHIDIRAGGSCYSHAYKALAESDGADCFVILGTGHYGVSNLFSILPMDFDTPLGRVQHDKEFVDALKSRLLDFDFVDVLPHRTEHSIEFQLVFLQHLLQSKKEFTFVPILCSFSYHFLAETRFRKQKKQIEEFAAALRATIAGFGKRVCLIGSVDFSHVGPRYGDHGNPDSAFLKRVEEADSELITAVERMNPEEFHQAVAAKEDSFRICGYSSIYTMLKAMGPGKGKLLDYASTEVDDKNSTVTFASMVLV